MNQEYVYDLKLATTVRVTASDKETADKLISSFVTTIGIGSFEASNPTFEGVSMDEGGVTEIDGLEE